MAVTNRPKSCRSETINGCRTVRWQTSHKGRQKTHERLPMPTEPSPRRNHRRNQPTHTETDDNNNGAEMERIA